MSHALRHGTGIITSVCWKALSQHSPQMGTRQRSSGQYPPLLRLGLCLFLLGLGAPSSASEPNNTLLVSSTVDSGQGSLRQAILSANALPGPQTIRFAAINGPFGTPQRIRLRRPLPVLRDDLTIDGYIEDRLWQAVGVTLSGENRHQLLQIAPGARVTLRSFTISNGYARRGGGIVNRGELLLSGMTFSNNQATQDGGALVNLGGTLTLINSTLVGNRAGQSGGGLANVNGRATITHGTFSANRAKLGGGLFSNGPLLLRNTIVANSLDGKDCTVQGALDPASTHNLIETHQDCGQPVSTADPQLESLGLYNGPTPTLPLGGSSPATNMGDNTAARDEHGKPLVWDQRGNGDPRFVAGYADIGAFEVQAFPQLRVNTVADNEMRVCSGSGINNCSLRGAIMLANAMGKPAAILFDSLVFATVQIITLTSPLPDIKVALTLDGRNSAGVTIRGASPILHTAQGGTLLLHQLVLENSR